MRLLILSLLLAVSPAVFSEEIRVLSGGAARPFVAPVTESFSAHAVKVEYATMGKLTRQLAAQGADAADLLIVTSEVFEQLGKEGKLAPASGTPIARVGIGVAVQQAAPLPDISTPEALRRTLLAARSIAHINPATGSSGKYVVDAFRKLGIENEMKAKTTLVDEGPAAEPVGRGEVELAIHQISEILVVKGAKLAGPLPAPFQKYTVYVAVPVPGTRHAPAVAQYVAHLTSGQARGRLAAAGYSQP
jgi:molybdate transport system substrate-binding protein